MPPAERAKILLTSALEKMGPIRAQAGLESHGHRWDNCFLACAYDVDFWDHTRHALCRKDELAEVAKITSLTTAEVGTVINTYDGDTRWFRRLVNEWLESNREDTCKSKPQLEPASV